MYIIYIYININKYTYTVVGEIKFYVPQSYLYKRHLFHHTNHELTSLVI